jgi:lipopolysaccharide/colanic/teichoic acid biosynthesis glycosyltransferase
MRRAAKRAFDVAVSTLVLLVLAPVLLVVALAVKLDSRGPVLFSQERVGRAGRRFRILKFRTMVTDAAVRGPNVSAVGDRRITRVGRLLRSCFIDEAPQLVNVLRGDMSLVGPRPETPEYVELLSPAQRRVLSVRPGMTGPSTLAYSAKEAQILAGQEDPDRYYREQLLHDRVSADLQYIERVSLRRDVWILVQTGFLVVSELAEAAWPVAREEGEPARPVS